MLSSAIYAAAEAYADGNRQDVTTELKTELDKAKAKAKKKKAPRAR